MSGPGRPGPAPDRIPARWVEAVELYRHEMRASRFSPGTIRIRISYLRQFAVENMHCDPRSTSRDDLINHLSAHTEWRHNTARSARAAFRGFFSMLKARGFRDDDPAEHLPSIRTPRSLPRPCPDDVVREAFMMTTDPTARLALRIAVETGLRRAEIASLRPKNVEGGPGSYALRVTGKGGHVRLVPIDDDLANTLLAIRTGYVFPSPAAGHKHLTADHIGGIITAALPGGWTTHTLRHRFATRAYQATKDIRAVQELMGHVSPTTTAIYTRAEDSAVRAAAVAARLA